MSLTADLGSMLARGEALPPQTQGMAGHAVSVVTDLDALRDEWLDLARTGHATPYQFPDWVIAYAGTVAKAAGLQVTAACLRAPSGELKAVLPLELSRRQGVRIAGIVGGKHANYQMPAMSPDFARQVTPDVWRGALAAIARDAGIDAFAFAHQPTRWQDLPNRLAQIDSVESISRAYSLPLSATGEETLLRTLSSHARKKMRSKRNRFVEFGPSRVFRAKTRQDIDAVLAAFLPQKAERFREMGIADPFAVAGMEDFLREGAESGALEFYALELNGAIISCYIGAADGQRFSGMATSFAKGDDELTRTSPGEILLVDLIHALCGRGFAMFDLGVGDARYKATICDQVETLHDGLIGITARGRLWCSVRRGLIEAKRRIKASPSAMALIGKLRRGTQAGA